MRRAALFLAAVAVCLLFPGCAGFSSQPPPGPMPLPEPWKPAPVLRAQVPPSDGGVPLDDRDGLSPDEAAILAVDQNPRLRAARAERGIGQAELLSAGVLPNPRLAGSLDFPVGGPDANVLGYDAGLSWNVTPLLSRGARVSAAEHNLASVDLEIAWQEWQVAQSARLHTIRSIFLDRRVAVARDLETTWRQRLDDLHRARAAGAVTDLELTGVEWSHAEARVTRLELEQHVATERAALSRAIGIDPARVVTLDARFVLPTLVPGEELLDELPRRRLDLIALQQAHLSHDEALRAAVIAQFPPVEIGFHGRREVDENVSVGVALSFEIPFFDGNQGAVTRERALRSQVEDEYDARLLEARADVLHTMKEIGLVREQISAARQAAEAARRLAEQARTAAASGALSSLVAADVLERSYASRLRALEVEQALGELHVALALVSGYGQ